VPAPVSKKQYRYMMAILHGDKGGSSARGDRVPKSVAGKYHASKVGDLPESKGKEHEGGTWNEDHHKKDKQRVDAKRAQRKKDSAERKAKAASMKKSLEEFTKGKGAGCIVVDPNGRILLGRRSDTGDWATPGGHVEPMEHWDEAALRELREETGLVGANPREIYSGRHHGNDTKSFVVESFRGKLNGNGEMNDLQFFEPHQLPWDSMRAYAVEPIKLFIAEKAQVNKSLKYMLAYENLQKNIIRSNAVSDAVHEVTHGDSLQLIGNGTFRFLRNAVRGMQDEDFKDVKLDGYTISIRKHTNDVYSGRINDGHKVVHQFTNRSLPALCAELMSVFEWYMPEDEKELELLDESALPDDAIEGGFNSLMEHYKRHNISNIYQEMENIRTEIRHGNAVDLQQVEQKIMKLFDRMEETIHAVVDKHNELTEMAGNELDQLETRLRELQAKVDELSKKPETVEAYSSNPGSPTQIHSNFYPYLPRPSVEISPDGRIKIAFGSEWTPMEKENFLQDMKAKAVNKAKK
jgi:8-oxo-dGTP pyrophosphatase MutT (NUDIX family)